MMENNFASATNPKFKKLDWRAAANDYFDYPLKV